MVSGTKSNLRPATSGTQQILTLQKILFDIFINNLENGMGSSLSKLVVDTKLDGEYSMLAGKGLFQTYLNRPDKWTDRKLPRFSKVESTIWDEQQDKLGASWVDKHQKSLQN